LSKEEIFERVKRIIAEETCIPENEITWDMNFADIENGSAGKSSC
jgi:hypothetical protein